MGKVKNISTSTLPIRKALTKGQVKTINWSNLVLTFWNKQILFKSFTCVTGRTQTKITTVILLLNHEPDKWVSCHFGSLYPIYEHQFTEVKLNHLNKASTWHAWQSKQHRQQSKHRELNFCWHNVTRVLKSIKVIFLHNHSCVNIFSLGKCVIFGLLLSNWQILYHLLHQEMLTRK